MLEESDSKQGHSSAALWRSITPLQHTTSVALLRCATQTLPNAQRRSSAADGALERTLLTWTWTCRTLIFFTKTPLFLISSRGGRLESALGAVFSSF